MKITNKLFSPYHKAFRLDSNLLEAEAQALGFVTQRVAPTIFSAGDVMFFCSDVASVGSALAVNHKGWTKQVLGRAGVPVPEGGCYERLVDVPDFPFTLAVKPADATGARGVSIDVTRRSDQFHGAFRNASRHSDEVIVEQYIAGDKFRLLTLGDEVIAGFKSQTQPGKVASAHAGARRVEAIAEVTEQMKAVAVSALGAIPGLHLAGVDIIAGADGPFVLEVNATPRIWGHHNPDEGEPVNVAAKIARYYLEEK